MLLGWQAASTCCLPPAERPQPMHYATPLWLVASPTSLMPRSEAHRSRGLRLSSIHHPHAFVLRRNLWRQMVSVGTPEMCVVGHKHARPSFPAMVQTPITRGSPKPRFKNEQPQPDDANHNTTESMVKNKHHTGMRLMLILNTTESMVRTSTILNRIAPMK